MSISRPASGWSGSIRKDMEKVVSVMIEARDITLFRLGPDDELTASANQSVGLILWVRREYAKAEPYFRDYLVLMIKHHPEKWIRFVTESRIGYCLLEKKSFDDAGQLLFSACAAMKGRDFRLTDVAGSAFAHQIRTRRSVGSQSLSPSLTPKAA